VGKRETVKCNQREEKGKGVEEVWLGATKEKLFALNFTNFL
jgi:hypothetical protein